MKLPINDASIEAGASAAWAAMAAKHIQPSKSYDELSDEAKEVGRRSCRRIAEFYNACETEDLPFPVNVVVAAMRSVS